MLIVNADDFGINDLATDRILLCLRERVVSSTSAMVFEVGSAAAAERARSEGHRAIGIHVNLSRSYSGTDVPEDVSERQTRAIATLGQQRLGHWIYDPRIQTVIDRCIVDQMARFRALYGREPTHIDSHHHTHVRPNVFFSEALPSGAGVRNTRIWTRRRSRILDAARRGRQSLLRRRFFSPDAIICLDVLIRTWPAEAIAPTILAYAKRAGTAEVMVHPEDPAELEFLLSESWRRALGGTRVGSFAEWMRDR
jgi:predicted glycoside hydrolase/deacetylase ChbG (UPF0249 family)